MPWRNLPEWMTHLPDWLQWAAGLLAMLGAILLGALAKIADDVKSGDRRKFWSKQMWLELPALGMMTLVGWGLTEHYSLGSGASVVLGAVLGWSGPKVLEAIIEARILKSWRK